MEKNLRQQIDIFSILRDVAREWITILLFAISASLLTNVWVTETYVPVYTSKAIFTVSSKSANGSIYQDLSSAESLAGRFAKVLESNVLKKKVAEDLGQESFTAQTSVKQIEETNMVELTVTANSAMDSYRTITSIMENYDQVSHYVVGNVILYVIQQPVIPLSPSNSKSPVRPMQYAFLLGALAAIAYVAFLSHRRDTVKNSHQMKEKIDAKLLGTVYHEKVRRNRKKPDEHPSMLIANPLRSFAFVESSRMAAARVRSRMDRSHVKVVMVTSVAENEGKSTVVANVALSIAREGKKVLLIDCDFRKPSQYKIFGQTEERNFVRLLKDGKAEAAVTQYQNTSLYGVFNTQADPAAERLLESGELKRMIDRYRESMDYIILDTAPLALVSDTEDLARLAESTVLVVREDVILAKKINDTIDVLNQTNAQVLGCILNNAAQSLTVQSGYNGYSAYGGHYGKYAK
ncbi:MAG: polysaccharide biosynthesis tyrosine autokinase [Butyricicoccus sp.]|nr:polysaccharide biosynthesis tyrosine autokinase [Butyricicoccus sp.]